MEYSTIHFPRYTHESVEKNKQWPANTINAVHDERVWRNTVKYTRALLAVFWLAVFCNESYKKVIVIINLKTLFIDNPPEK